MLSSRRLIRLNQSALAVRTAFGSVSHRTNAFYAPAASSHFNTHRFYTVNTTTPTTTTTEAIETTTTTTEATKPRGRLLFITLKNSRFHKPKHLTEAFKVLGLKLINQTVVHKDSPSIRGLVFRVRNFVDVESVSTAELFPEGTEHIQIERKSRYEMRQSFVQAKKEERKNTQKFLEEAEKVVLEYKKQTAQQQ